MMAQRRVPYPAGRSEDFWEDLRGADELRHRAVIVRAQGDMSEAGELFTLYVRDWQH